MPIVDFLFLKIHGDFSGDLKMSLVVRKPVFGVFDLVPHKPGCTATEDG